MVITMTMIMTVIITDHTAQDDDHHQTRQVGILSSDTEHDAGNGDLIMMVTNHTAQADNRYQTRQVDKHGSDTEYDDDNDDDGDDDDDDDDDVHTQRVVVHYIMLSVLKEVDTHTTHY